MANRKEELLAMLKSTLALSRNSLGAPLQELAEEIQTCSDQSNKCTDHGIHQFLYGTPDSGVHVSADVRMQNSDSHVEFDYNHGETFQKRMNSSDLRNLMTQINDCLCKENEEILYDMPTNGSFQCNASYTLQATHGKRQSLFSEGNSYGTTNEKVLTGNELRYKTMEVDSSSETNKLVDDILKTIPVDEKLSKMISEKMKKPDRRNFYTSNKMNLLEPSFNVKSKLQENAEKNSFGKYSSILKSLNLHNAPRYKSDKVTEDEFETSDWNRKTENFLRKLQISETGLYDEQKCIDNQMNWSPKEKTLQDIKKKLKRSVSERSEAKSSSPPKKKNFVMNESVSQHNFDTSVGDDVNMSSGYLSSSDERHFKLHYQDNESPSSFHGVRIETVIGKNELKDNGISKDDIFQTIEALEIEIRKLGKKRLKIATKPSSLQNEMIINTNLRMQGEMKSQIRKLRQVIIDEKSSLEESSHRDDEEAISTLERKHARKDSESHGSKVQRSRSSIGSSDSYESSSNSRCCISKGYQKEHEGPNRRLKGILKVRQENPDNVTQQNTNQLLSGVMNQRDSFNSKFCSESRQICKCNVQVGDTTHHCSSLSSRMEKSRLDQTADLKPKEPQSYKLIEDRVRLGIGLAVSLYMNAMKFYDGGNLWCQCCDVLCSNTHELGLHLHTQEHLLKLGHQDDDVPKSIIKEDVMTSNGAPARGDEFIKPVKAFYCSLCKEFCKDSPTLKDHFTSLNHNEKFKEFVAGNKNYEVPYLARKMTVVLREGSAKAKNNSVECSKQVSITSECVSPSNTSSNVCKTNDKCKKTSSKLIDEGNVSIESPLEELVKQGSNFSLGEKALKKDLGYFKAPIQAASSDLRTIKDRHKMSKVQPFKISSLKSGFQLRK